MFSSRRSSIGLRLVVLALLLPALTACPPKPKPVATPAILKQQFKSSSGSTVLQYYEYSGSCRATTGCNYRGVIHTLPGFTLAEVFLTGFTLESKTSSGRLQGVSTHVQKFNYDRVSGAMEIGVNGSLALDPSQPYTYRTTFVVVLTDTLVARFTKLGNGCVGPGSCHIIKVLPNAVPAGMDYIGFASRLFHLGTSGTGPVMVHALGAHQDGLSVTPPSVQIDYTCVLQDTLTTNPMFCEWDGSVIAFVPSEMTRNASPLFPQYTFISTGATAAVQWTEHALPFGNVPFTGILSAFEGAYFEFPVPQVNPIWKLQVSADDVRVVGAPPNDALVDYGTLLGHAFGTTQAALTKYQVSHAVGFLR